MFCLFRGHTSTIAAVKDATDVLMRALLLASMLTIIYFLEVSALSPVFQTGLFENITIRDWNRRTAMDLK
jgi:hypothetical protein